MILRVWLGFALWLAVGVAQAQVAGARPGGAVLVAIPAVRTIGDVPQRAQAAFEQALAAEVRKLEGVGAIGAAEIADLASASAEGRMRGCTQDDACLLEVAAALGVAELLSSEIAVDGGDYALSVRRLGSRSGKALGATTRRLPRGNGQGLLDAVGPAIQALYPDRPLKPGLVRGADAALGRWLNPPPLPRWIFATTAIAAGVSLAGGAAYGLAASGAHKDWQQLVDLSQTQPVSGAQLQATQARYDSYAHTSTVLIGAGAVLGVAAVVEAFFTDWRGDRAQLLVTPVSQGVVVSASGRF